MPPSALPLLASAAVLAMAVGCNLSGSSSDKDYSGNWSGRVCGRGLDMVMHQDGTTLTGTYTLSDPTFSEPFHGTVENTQPPAKATLRAGGGRKFEITFERYNQLSGTFYNPGPVCAVSAVK